MSKRRHVVTDAHGRSLDLTAIGQAPQVPAHPSPQHRLIPSVVAVTAVLVGGVVGIALINAIHDIAMTVAGTGATGLIFKALLATSSRQER
ncbi:hypothetical protein [Streptomyces sp. OE57]|uniref:hypothetical protein n=1 Tax=Streptomyces lacaronensis TaxID=3379885 RepID=UPI0039B764E8